MTVDTRPAPSPWAGLGILLLSWLLFALAFAITSWIVPGMDVSGGFWSYIWVSALFGLVNVFIGTLLRLITFPLIALTFGLFAIFLNACLLALTDWLSDSLTIDDFWWTAIWAAIVLGLVTLALQLVVQAVAGESERDRFPG
jgi:putative membrane protein